MAKNTQPLAYRPPTTRKQASRRSVTLVAAVVVAVILVAGIGWLIFKPSPPDRTNEAHAALERMFSTEVIEAAGTVRRDNGSQHPFTVDIRTEDGDARGAWSAEDGSNVSFVFAGGNLFAAVNPGAWKAVGLDSHFQGWAIFPQSLLGETPVRFIPSAVLESISGAPTSIDGDTFTYGSGTVVRLRDGRVTSIKYDGTDFSLSTPQDESANDRIVDWSTQAKSARVASVNELSNGGFSVTTPPPPPAATPGPSSGAPTPPAAPTSGAAASESPSASPEAAATTTARRR